MLVAKPPPRSGLVRLGGLCLLLGLGCQSDPLGTGTGPGARQLPAMIPAPPELPDGDVPTELADYVRGRMLMVPVDGIGPQQVPDTFLSPRSGGRRHEASDISAPRGAQVVSADDGQIVRVGTNRLGGNVIYAVDPGGRLLYYYAHLQGFADGLAAGQAVRRGDLLGYVGTTGNAPEDAPHLHFQLMQRPPSPVYPSQGGPALDARRFFLLAGERRRTDPLRSQPQPVAQGL